MATLMLINSLVKLMKRPIIHNGKHGIGYNALPETNTVPVGMKVGVEGVYTIAATEINDLSAVHLKIPKPVFSLIFQMVLTLSVFTPGENEQTVYASFQPAVNR